MASPVVRRPLPALIALVALLALTGIVWWRVMNRGDVAAAGGCPTQTSTPTPSATAAVVPAPAAVSVQVLNSTTRAGLATSVRRTLQDRGFAVAAPPGNDKKGTKNTGVAQLRFGPAGRPGALLLRYYFPGAALVPTTTAGSTVVVAVGQKFTSVRGDAAVRAALAHDRVATASPTPAPTTSTAGC